MDDDIDEFIAVLQDLVLPTGVPVLPGLDLGVHFAVPGASGDSTGAWFDVTVLESGLVAFVLGQVPGSGMAAAMTAGSVNAVLRSGLLRYEDVATALELADGYARPSLDARGTTVVVATLDPRTGDLTYATAGHDAPVVGASDGVVHHLPRTGNDPIGSLQQVTPGTHRLHRGDVMLLGSAASLRTPRARDEAERTAELLAHARVPGDATGTAAAVGQEVHAGHSGAVVVVAAELRDPAGSGLDVDLDLDDMTGGHARQELGAWLAGVPAPSMDTLTIMHAALELVANASEHSRLPGESPSRINLSATHTAAGEVVVDVTDQGRWRPPSLDPVRGRGLAMTAGLIDKLAVDPGENGTHAQIRHRLARPVLVERSPLSTEGPDPEPLKVTHSELGTVRLAGAFGHDDLDRINAELLLASRGGTLATQVDLSQVTVISAAGLHLLREMVRPAPQGSPTSALVTLRAPSGTAAEAELDRAGIAHDAS